MEDEFPWLENVKPFMKLIQIDYCWRAQISHNADFSGVSIGTYDILLKCCAAINENEQVRHVSQFFPSEIFRVEWLVFVEICFQYG